MTRGLAAHRASNRESVSHHDIIMSHFGFPFLGSWVYLVLFFYETTFIAFIRISSMENSILPHDVHIKKYVINLLVMVQKAMYTIF